MSSIQANKQKIQYFFEKYGDEIIVSEGPVEHIKYDIHQVRGDFEFVKKEAIRYIEERIQYYQDLKTKISNETEQ